MKKYVKYSWIALCVIAQVKASVPSPSKPPTLKTAEKQRAQQHVQPAMRATSSPPKPSAVNAVVAGTGAGVAEVAIAGQALSYFVNRAVQGDKFTLDSQKWDKKGYISLRPRDVYRGTSASAAGMGGITAVQVGGTDVAKEKMEQALGRELVGLERVAPPMVAGAAAGAAVAPAQEGIPNYQQNVKAQEGREISATQATKEMRTKYGVTAPWRGATPTAIRDMKFTLGYKVLPTLILEQATPYFGNNSYTQWGSKITAGVGTALATHSWHVVARHMQNNRALPSTWAAACDLYAKEGVAGFNKGIGPRGARVMIAIPVLSWAEAKAMALLKRFNSPQGK